MNLNNKRGAFTLVELLVVIAILAILAVIAIPQVIGLVNTARNSAIKSDLGEVSLIATRVEMERGVFDTVDCLTGNDPRIEEICTLAARNVPEGRGNIHSIGRATTYCIEAQLHPIEGAAPNFWCVDHTGVTRLNIARVCSATGSITRVIRLITATGTATADSALPTNIVIPRFTETGVAAASHTVSVPRILVGDTGITVAGKIAAGIRASAAASIDWDVSAVGNIVTLTARRYGIWSNGTITPPAATGISYTHPAGTHETGPRSRCFLY